MEYGLFLVKSITVLASLLIIIVVVAGLGHRIKQVDKGHIEVKSLNDAVDNITHGLKQMVLDPQARKIEFKSEKKKAKEEVEEERAWRMLLVLDSSNTRASSDAFDTAISLPDNFRAIHKLALVNSNNDEDILTQIPLRLCYAITINKCQGITLPSVVVEIKNNIGGLGYVALSRVRNIEDLYIIGEINWK
ncbi:MAG: hypothetical protein IIB71_12785, partial [Proteobacteria bacterium]|nr:hypothetical protein [Pseudomonadota bacterium]